MFGRTSLLKATALALPFSLAAAAAHAASIAETVQQNEELSTFAKAMEAAQFDQQLSGEGPYTVFAPSDRAFEQLPAGALDELMKQENQAQLIRLLEHHVVEGEAIAADDVLGEQSQIDVLSGDTLTVDGTSEVVLLVPTGLTIARVGDQMVIEREGVAVSTRAFQVQDQMAGSAGTGQQQVQGQQAGAQTPAAEGSDMPMSPHQQQALESQPAPDQQQTATAGAADMPATEHQQQVLHDQAGQAQGQAQGQQQAQGQAQGQQAGAQTPTAEGSDMPMTEHQQQALESQPAKQQRQTAAQGAADMPATEHQQQVLQDQAGQGQEQAQGQQQTQGQGQMQGQQAGAQTTTAQGSDMPMSPHQQQALESQPAADQQQTAAAGTADMPATEHQQQVIQDQAGQGQGQAQGQMQGQGQEGEQAGAQTPTAEDSGMPISPHQQQALESHPAPDQQQTAAADTADMPATEHQQQVIQDQAGQGQGQQQAYGDAAITGQPDLLREATVVGADIQADNGVIHVIDAVLLPPDVLKTLEEEARQGQG